MPGLSGRRIVQLSCLIMMMFLTSTVVSQFPGSPFTTRRKLPDFITAAYLPDYRINGIEWASLAEHLTDIIIFSVQISPSGDIKGLERVQHGLAQAAKQKAVTPKLRVLLSVGGGGRSEGFPFVSKRSKDRKNFVKKLIMLCNEQGLDGIDFDWEGVDFSFDHKLLLAYQQLLIQAKKQFKKYGKIVSVALHPGQEKYMIDNKVADAVDRFHFMTYDQCAYTPCQHSTLDGSMAQVQSLMQVLMRNSVSPSKIVLGIPAYARLEAQPSEVATYNDILVQYPQLDAQKDRVPRTGASTGDELEGVGFWYFNGPVTVKAKINAARRHGIGGVYLWEAGQDVPPSDGRSLIRAMGEEVLFGAFSPEL